MFLAWLGKLSVLGIVVTLLLTRPDLPSIARSFLLSERRGGRGGAGCCAAQLLFGWLQGAATGLQVLLSCMRARSLSAEVCASAAARFLRVCCRRSGAMPLPARLPAAQFLLNPCFCPARLPTRPPAAWGLYGLLSSIMDGPAVLLTGLLGLKLSPHFDKPWLSSSFASW